MIMTLFTPHGHLVPLHQFRGLLRQGADPNEVWHGIRNGEPVWHLPLIQAARSADELGYLRLLIDHEHTDLEVADMECRSALHLATSHGNPDAVRLLLHAGAEIDTPDTYGSTALHYACNTVDDKAMGLLLEAGANPNARNLGGYTPFLETLKSYSSWPKPFEDKVAMLLRHGALVNDSEPNFGITPLYAAANAGWARITTMLLIAGADPRTKVGNGERPLDAVLRQLAIGAGRKDAALRATYAALVAHDRKGLLACVEQMASRMDAMRRAM